MKLARVTCPGCRNPYEQAVTPDTHFVACPGCGQNNSIPDTALTITGLCLNCERPLDDHIWRGNLAAHCP